MTFGPVELILLVAVVIGLALAMRWVFRRFMRSN